MEELSFMQCSTCRAVFSNGLDHCPRCHDLVANPVERPATTAVKSAKKELVLMVNEDVDCESPPNAAVAPPSTLIEFPGSGRAAQPAWRKELSERVREIQERRSREAAKEARENELQRKEKQTVELTGTPLGLVPRADQPPLNPLVAAALKRIERAQQSRTRTSTRGASVAVARVADEQFEVAHEVNTRPSLVAVKEPHKEIVPSELEASTQRQPTLSVVQPKSNLEQTSAISIIGPGETAIPAFAGRSYDSQDLGALAPGEIYDDYAPHFSRTVAGLIDLFVVAFASSPFAAIIELTNGDWSDERVVASMGGILIIVMFLYLISSISAYGK